MYIVQVYVIKNKSYTMYVWPKSRKHFKLELELETNLKTYICDTACTVQTSSLSFHLQ